MAVTVGYCGVCCNHCGMQSRIAGMAKELSRFIKAYRYEDWIQHVTGDFEFRNFMKGLDWFSGSVCKGCIEWGGMPNCDVRNCCKQKGLRNCYSCEDFPECRKLAYQKETYRIDENRRRIEQVGYDNWLKEQLEKTKKGFDNIHFLQAKA
jgi:hypothetical protein